MRWTCAVLLGALVLAGCRGSSTGRSSLQPAGRPGSESAPPNPGLIVTPAHGATGRILLVNAGARFVVVSYPLGNVPPPDRRLNVYRDGLKVAEIKITGPRRDTNTVADIVAGECRTGDEVRED